MSRLSPGLAGNPAGNFSGWTSNLISSLENIADTAFHRGHPEVADRFARAVGEEERDRGAGGFDDPADLRDRHAVDRAGEAVGAFAGDGEAELVILAVAEGVPPGGAAVALSGAVGAKADGQVVNEKLGGERAGFLLLGYAGSRFVLEVVLQRAG